MGEHELISDCVKCSKETGVNPIDCNFDYCWDYRITEEET